MPIMNDQDEHFINPNEVDIIEAFAAHAATCTPDQLQDSEEALALVARSVSRREVRETPQADEACRKEWDRLEKIGCWDPASVGEWQKLRREANAAGEIIHVGSLHEFCTEKGSELAIDHPDRKYKGRVVFLGDRVTDQAGRIAVFEEMASNPATMEAGKMTDF